VAELYRFFDGTVSDPRSYSADDFAEYFRQFIRNGVFNGGDELQVSSQQVGLKTYVKPGKAWINGYFYKNTDNLFLDHNASHATMDRIDRVVLRLDYDLRTMGVRVLPGVPGVTPQPPALTRNNNVYELSLAQVKIKAGAVSVSPADIVDERFNGNVCGIVTHLFEQVDTTEIFAQFTAEWRQWFEEVKEDTNLVPRSEAFLFMSIPQFQQAVQNPFLMEQMVQQFLALDVITSNPTAMDIIASSEVAMEAITASEVAMEAVAQSEVALAAIGQVSIAIGKLAAGLAGLDPRDYADITAVVASEIAIEAVVASEVAMRAVAASEVAMEAVVNNAMALSEVINSEIAMEAVAASEVAMKVVAASEVAMEAVINNERALSEVVNSEVAMEAVAQSGVALSAIFDSWPARLAIWESEMASQIIMQQARAWLEANVAETAYRSSGSSGFSSVVNKKGLLLAIRHDTSTTPGTDADGEMRVFAQAPNTRRYTDIVGGSLAANTWYDVAYRMVNFQVKNRQSDGTILRRLDFRYVPMEP
jgi:hypothetical protein